MKNIYIRLLQFLIGTEVDGDFGPKSEAAADRLITQLEGYQEAFSGVLVLKEGGKDGNNNAV